MRMQNFSICYAARTKNKKNDKIGNKVTTVY